MRFLKGVGWFGALALLVVAGPARAQTEAELTAARARFAEGVELTGQERWGEAVAAFREVLAVRATSPVRYNLAFALAQTGEAAEAATLLDEVLADPELQAAMRRDASALLTELEPGLGRLTVVLSGDEAGVEVRVDDEAISLDHVGSPMRVAAGAHTVTLHHGPEVRARAEVTVAAGATESVTLSTGSTVMEDLPPPEDPSDDRGEDVTETWWFWTIVGAGVVALGVGITIGVAVSTDGSVQPIAGNLDPGILTVTP